MEKLMSHAIFRKSLEDYLMCEKQLSNLINNSCIRTTYTFNCILMQYFFLNFQIKGSPLLLNCFFFYVKCFSKSENEFNYETQLLCFNLIVQNPKLKNIYYTLVIV